MPQKDLSYVIIGIHRSIREVVGWAGKEGFVPLTSERQLSGYSPRQLKKVNGDTAEALMSHITKHRVGGKYEFVLVPVIDGATQIDEAQTEAGLILPHLH